MTYQHYINLGFKRIELNDQIEFEQTGYSGFILSYKLSKHWLIEATELDNPKLYFKNNFIADLTKESILKIIK